MSTGRFRRFFRRNFIEGTIFVDDSTGEVYAEFNTDIRSVEDYETVSLVVRHIEADEADISAP